MYTVPFFASILPPTLSKILLIQLYLIHLGIEAQVPIEQDLMRNSSVEFHPYQHYPFNQSTDNVFAAFSNMTTTYVLPHATIISQISKTGKNKSWY